MHSEDLNVRTASARVQAATALLWLSIALVILFIASLWSLSPGPPPPEALILVPSCVVLMATLAGPHRWRMLGLFAGLQLMSIGIGFRGGFWLPSPWVISFSCCAVAALVVPARQAWLVWAGGLLLWIGCGVWFVTGAPPPSGAAYDVHRSENWLRTIAVYAGFSAGLMGSVTWLVTRMEQAITNNEQMLLRLARETDRRAEAVQQERRLETELQQSQKVAAIGALAGGIAQDFGTLLAVMVEHAERIALAVHTPAHKQAAEAIVSAAESGKTLARRLDTYNQRRELINAAIDVGSSVRAALPILRRLLPRSIALELHCDDDLPTVFGPAEAIEQMLLNLSVNAGDALPHGGTIRIRATAREGRVWLQVSDDGVGMDAATCARVFDRFFTTKGAGKGTGLGLSTVHDLVTGCGGQVTVKSAPGAGTTFDVWLPARPELRAEVDLPTRSAVILVIEDDPAVRDVLVATLENAGHSVIRAVDASDALRVFQARSDEVRLVVTSAVNGTSELRELYEAIHVSSPALPFLVCVRASDTVAPMSPQTALLIEPFGRQELLSKVASLLDREV